MFVSNDLYDIMNNRGVVVMESKIYYFHPDKNVTNRGYVLDDEIEDHDKKVLYEAKVLKKSFFSGTTVGFMNYTNNKYEEHKVGVVVTSKQDNVFEKYSPKSSFKFDGKDIWAHLIELGIKIDSAVAANKIGTVYSINYNGTVIGTISTSVASGGGNITSNFTYQIVTHEANFDLVFLVAFAIAKTEQFFYV